MAKTRDPADDGARPSAIKLAPSILSADFARLGEQAAEAARAGADRLHLDVMDGHFVPNITIGPVVVRSLRAATTLSLEAHLMITDPDRYIDDFATAGADGIIVHAEGATHLHRTVQRIRANGKRAGVAINPATPAAVIEEILPDLDLVLVMTVNPGFGGQEFIQGTEGKIRRVREMIARLQPACELEVDGGIAAKTAGTVVGAGARVLVAGSAVFGARESVAAAMARLRRAAEKVLVPRPPEPTRALTKGVVATVARGRVAKARASKSRVGKVPAATRRAATRRAAPPRRVPRA